MAGRVCCEVAMKYGKHYRAIKSQVIQCSRLPMSRFYWEIQQTATEDCMLNMKGRENSESRRLKLNDEDDSLS